MLRRNVSGQFLYFALVNASTGAALLAATVIGKRALDGVAQAAVTGAITEEAGGQYKIALSQADINGNNCGFLFTATSAIPVSICVVTTAADPTNAATFGLTNLDAAVSTRSTYAGGPVASVTAAVSLAVTPPTAAQVRTEMDTNSTRLANLDALVSSRSTFAGGAVASVTAAVTAVADPNVALIKAKTDNLPAAPAAISNIPTAIQNADALLTRDWTLVAGEAARSVLNALRFLRNKWSVVAGTLTVTKEDNVTQAWTGTVTTDATALPVTGSTSA